MGKIKASLIGIPLIFIAINFIYLSVIFPIYSAPPGYDQDPAYAYLFNGLLLIDGQGPWQVDHPGTPLQFLCAISILLAHAIFYINGTLGPYDLIDNVLSNAESYLYVTSSVLITINAITLYYFGKKINQATGKIWVAIFCQFSGLAFTIMSPRAGYVAPEALLITASLLLIAQLAPVIFRAADQKEIYKKEPSNLLIGMICGFGIIVKVNFLPMFGLVLLLGSITKIFKVGIYTLATSVILLIPTYLNFSRMFDWLWNIASHSGLHGSGQKFIFQWSQFWPNIASLISWYGPLYVVMFLLFFYVFIECILRTSRMTAKVSEKQNLSVPLIFILVVLAQTAIVLKHPGAHYFIPVLPLAFVGLAWLLIQSEQFINISSQKNKFKYQLFIGCTAFVFAAISVLPTLKQINVMRIQRAEQDKSLAIINRTLQEYASPLVICAFRCTVQKYAIAYGLTYAPGLSDRPIVKTLLKDHYEYNFLVKEMLVPGSKTLVLHEIDGILKNKKIFLITPKDYPDLAVFKLRIVVSAGVLTLYEITGLSDSSIVKQSRDQTN